MRRNQNLVKVCARNKSNALQRDIGARTCAPCLFVFRDGFRHEDATRVTCCIPQGADFRHILSSQYLSFVSILVPAFISTTAQKVRSPSSIGYLTRSIVGKVAGGSKLQVFASSLSPDQLWYQKPAGAVLGLPVSCLPHQTRLIRNANLWVGEKETRPGA